MDEVNAEFIEQYQKLYAQDPKSKVFAPLAEAYRKVGMLDQALEVAEVGCRLHPDFPGGHVALGKIYLDLKRYEDAERELSRTIALSPENILAHQLLAETLLRLKKSKDALRTYKMLLFLSPNHERAQIAVRKLESLTADEFEDDVFAMKPLKESIKEWGDLDLDFEFDNPNNSTQKAPTPNASKKNAFIERILSLADAFLVRNDIERAVETLNEAERLIGPNPEIIKRLKLIHQRQLESVPHPRNSIQIQKPASREMINIDNQIDFLQDLLQKFNNRENRT